MAQTVHVPILVWKRTFETNSSFWLVETDFLSSGNHFSAHFLPQILHSGWWNQNFCLAETAWFYLQFLFRLAETFIRFKSVSTSQNEQFSWKARSTRRKKLLLAGASKKWKEKMVSTSQKISCPVARISSFLDCLLLIPIMVSTSSKIALTKKILFPLSRKSFCTSRFKDIKKYVSTIQKNCFSLENLWKNWKNRCPLAGVWLVLKNRFSLISLIVSISRKKLEIKKIMFPANKKHVSTGRNEGLAEKYDPVEGKIASTDNSWPLLEKMEENVFY